MKNHNEIVKKIIDLYPKNVCELNFNSAYELLIAVILSAQCTDKRVNEVTKKLFQVANTPQKILELGLEQLKNFIKPCGFFNNKANNIIKATKTILEEYGGEVPSNFEELVKLDGVGEKTANVVMAVFYHKPAIAVDTHVFRLANRIGLAKSKTPHECMVKLQKNISKELWIDAHFALVLHGRRCCYARKPNCESCVVKSNCDYYGGKNV